MTWASKADRAGRSKPLAMPVTKMTPRIGARLNAGSRDSSASATAQADREGARDQDDAPPVASVRDMTAEEHEREGRDGLDQSEPAERQAGRG